MLTPILIVVYAVFILMLPTMFRIPVKRQPSIFLEATVKGFVAFAILCAVVVFPTAIVTPPPELKDMR